MEDWNNGENWDGNVKKGMKNHSGRQRETSKSLPLEGGGKRVGVKEMRDVSRAPLTLTLFPKGRGDITFDNTMGMGGGTEDES